MVAAKSYAFQAAVLVGMSLLMTVGVYGLVAGIIKLDDVGLHLQKSASAIKKAVGRMLFNAAAPLMKLLSIVGTAAMFMVGGEFPGAAALVIKARGLVWLINNFPLW